MRSVTHRQRIGALMAIVGVVQGLVVALIYVVPIFSTPLPEHPDVVGTLLYYPPPPPPRPLPRGSALNPEVAKPEPPKPVVEDPPRAEREAPIQIPEPEAEAEIVPARNVRPDDQFGSETGSDMGDALGMEGGVESGMVGGLPGGEPGGVPGGTGSGPVRDYDAGPRIIRQTRPQYPQEAFVKKVEGTVLLEILIDSSGQVTRARVIQSIPLLDAAARDTVYQWLFQPAVKHGRPVAAIAHAPVRFLIY